MRCSSPPTLNLQVFPFTRWSPFPLTGESRDSVNVGNLHIEIRRKLSQIVNVPGQGIAYDVRVILPRVQSITTFASYASYVDIETSATLSEALSRGDSVEIKVLADSYVVVTPRPRDIGRLFYQIPALPNSAGYQVSIYSGTEIDKQLFLLYDKELTVENEKRDYPVYLERPVPTDEFDAPDKLIFFAHINGRFVGYCACTILRYRTEIGNLLERKIDDALKKASGSGEYPDALERYLKGVKPRNILEIEGLSVSPLFAGKNIGLVLLYEALRFVRDPLMMSFYPVTHITAQAASYVTKRYLISNFEFRYHGSNSFLNEGFIETLSDTTKQELMRVVRQFISYYNSFFEGERSQRITNAFHGNRNQQAQVLNMTKSVVNLYHLYYLLIASSRQRRGTVDETDDKTLTQLISIMDSLIGLLYSDPQNVVVAKDRQPYPSQVVANYFDLNRASLIKYGNDCTRSLLTIEETLNLPLPKGYGILPELIIGEVRWLLLGYDVIYSALPNLIALGTMLGITTELSTKAFRCINALLYPDLLKSFNYELPTYQMELIEISLENLLDKRILPSIDDNDTLKNLLIAINSKKELVTKNAAFNITFPIDIYAVPKVSTAGFDIFVSLNELISNWSNIENAIFERVNRAPSNTTTAICRPSLIAYPPLPKTREALFNEINELYGILRFRPAYNSMQEFNGAQYLVSSLVTHFNKLMGLRDTMGKTIEIVIIDDDDEVDCLGGMQVEEEAESGGYKLEDFIDDDLLTELPESSLNDVPI